MTPFQWWLSPACRDVSSLFLGEILSQSSHSKVIVNPDCAVLGEKLRELGTINRERFISGQNLEWLAEDELLDESGLYVVPARSIIRVSSFHSRSVKADFDMVAAFVGNRRSPRLC